MAARCTVALRLRGTNMQMTGGGGMAGKRTMQHTAQACSPSADVWCTLPHKPQLHHVCWEPPLLGTPLPHLLASRVMPGRCCSTPFRLRSVRSLGRYTKRSRKHTSCSE